MDLKVNISMKIVPFGNIHIEPIKHVKQDEEKVKSDNKFYAAPTTTNAGQVIINFKKKEYIAPKTTI